MLRDKFFQNSDQRVESSSPSASLLADTRVHGDLIKYCLLAHPGESLKLYVGGMVRVLTSMLCRLLPPTACNYPLVVSPRFIRMGHSEVPHAGVPADSSGVCTGC
jgi:hypothetical protein